MPSGVRPIVLLCAVVCIQIFINTSQAAQPDQTESGCRYSEIPLLNAELPFGQLYDQNYSTRRSFFGSVKYRNLANKSVDGLTALIEYSNADRSALISAVYVAFPTSETATVRGELHPDTGPQHLSESVAPGATVLLMTKSAMTTLQCPTSAVLELLDVRFHDGSVEHWEASSWDAGPALRSAPRLFRMPCGELLPGFSTRLYLRIDAEGRAMAIVKGEAVDPDTRECVATEMQNWHFYPALHNGKPVAFDASALERLTRGFISMTIIRPSSGLMANWMLLPPVSTPISRMIVRAASRIR